MIIYKIAVFIHVLSAIFWIGGMLFTVAVLVPVSRNKLLKAKKGAFFSLIGKKFSRISWVLFAVLIASGLTALVARGYPLSILTEAGFWQAGFGATLFIKLHLFACVLIVSGLHDFWLGPKAAQLMDEQPDSKSTDRFRKASRWAGRLNLLLGLAILYFAISLLRG
ncbi:MAG TPA: DUF4149 domain-containing protein [Balneolaceae bacterium]|nr:DUF4149 domain-containing protein [Balneolaceae bacterium]